MCRFAKSLTVCKSYQILRSMWRATHVAPQWSLRQTNIVVSWGHVFILFVCVVVSVQLYYTSLTSKHNSEALSIADKNVAFAASDAVDSLVPEGARARVGRCLNHIILDKFANKKAVTTSILNLQHGTPEFTAVLRLGVSIRQHLTEYNSIELVIVALLNTDYDSRVEIANAKMAGWNHVCFVDEMVPPWLAYRAGNKHHFINANAFGLTGYSRVLMLPTTSLVLRDISPLFELRGMITRHGGLVWATRPTWGFFMCVPTKPVFQNIMHHIQIVASQKGSEKTLIDGMYNHSSVQKIDATHNHSSVHKIDATHNHSVGEFDAHNSVGKMCVLNVLSNDVVGVEMQKLHDCNILVYIHPKPWNAHCSSWWGEGKACKMWNTADTKL